MKSKLKEPRRNTSYYVLNAPSRQLKSYSNAVQFKGVVYNLINYK